MPREPEKSCIGQLSGSSSLYLYSCLQISDDTDGYVYLLNPKIFTPDGDWEAWSFGSKIPGAFRYRSFWDMMRADSERIDT